MPKKHFLFAAIALLINSCIPPNKTAVSVSDEVVSPMQTETVAPPTQTPVLPTETPIVNTEPDASAPFCEDIGVEHDPHAWHPHWNAEAGCFWSEFHRDNPNSPEMVSIFGELPYPIFGGPQSSSPAEHVVKHSGDVVFAAAEGDPNWIPCQPFAVADNFSDTNINDCVKAYRMVLHADDAFLSFLFTVHGYYVEMKVCTQESDYQDCGIIRNRGQQFFANFRTQFYTERDLRPGGTLTYPNGYEFTILPDADNSNINDIVNDEPYVQLSHPLVDPNTGRDNLAFFTSHQGAYNKISWSSNEIGPCIRPFPDGKCRNNYIRWAFQAFDAGILPDESDLLHSPQICFGDENCFYDNSLKGVFEVGVYVEPEWDMIDGVADNHINGVVWVDRFQQPFANQNACTNEHLGDTRAGDCFKMEFENYPISPGVATNHRGRGILQDDGTYFKDFYLTEYNQCLPDRNCKVR